MARPLREGNQFARPDDNYTSVIKKVIEMPRIFTTVIEAKKYTTGETQLFYMHGWYAPVHFDYELFEEKFIRHWATEK